jgi:hypothetical protein
MIGPDEHACPKCGKAVSNERTELIGTDLCVNCTPQKPKPKAIMDYSHKTAGVLMICDDIPYHHSFSIFMRKLLGDVK